MKKSASLKILFATSEAHPLVKTGGLGDVSGSLPAAIHALRSVKGSEAGKSHNVDIRVILPAYRQVLRNAGKLSPVAWLAGAGTRGPVRILETRMPKTQVRTWLVDAPHHFDRDGGPYVDARGHDWPDNAERFALLARAVEGVALDQVGLGWRPDVVHCNDWQTGLVPALLADHPVRPATVFTIHNLAYQGRFPRHTLQTLGLPPQLWSMHALEFHGDIAFIKGGLVFSDWLTTVSPTYAREIRTPEFGHGLEGLLNHRAARLVGILNGADYDTWDPVHDAYIAKNYSMDDISGKQANKTALQETLGLPQDHKVPVIGSVGRLAWQKGGDVLIQALPAMAKLPLQFVLLGGGDKHQEQALVSLAKRNPERIAVRIGYDEQLAHQIEAGADMFIMLSRYEPCGLNQIYSLRYGTVPIVRRTGGLADTVVDVSDSAGRAPTGFLFDTMSAQSFLEAVQRALSLYADEARWRELMLRGMQQDFSWQRSAREYLELYDRAITDRGR